MTRLFPAAILLGSFLLRLALALQGGRYYFGDEARYDRGVQLYRALAAGDASSLRDIVAMPEHALFSWVAAAITAVQRVISWFTPFSDWQQPANIASTMWVAAPVLSLFSTLNLFLGYRLARVAGASREEARWALLLLAAANTAFYYSRHLLPYDCALSATLGALVVGLGRPTGGRALACGLCGGLTYGLYNGYWFLVPVVWLVHTLACWRESPRARLRLALACAAGVLLSLSFPLVLGTLLGGRAYWAVMLDFSGTVKQGLFAEGWSLPWEYLWHSEGPVGPVLLLALLAALWQTHRASAPLPDRVRATLIALAVAYGLLVLLSTGLERFVVYGRTVKPFVPALCLLGAWALHCLLAPHPRLRPAVALLLVTGALAHFAPHFTLVFPREFKVAVYSQWGVPKRVNSLSGTLYAAAPGPITRPDLALANAQILYPIRAPIALPEGVTLLRADHPLAYLPYQYEGHTPRERALLRTTDLTMRLIQLARPETVPDHPPPDQLFGPLDFPSGRR